MVYNDFVDFLNKINTIVSDKRFFPKIGIILGISFIQYLLYLGANLLSNSFSLINNFFGLNVSANALNSSSYVVGSIGPILISLFTLPLWLYLKGYLYKSALSIAKSSEINSSVEAELPEHDNYKKTVSLGSRHLSLNYTLSMPIILISLIPVIIFYSFSDNLQGPGSLPLVITGTLWILITTFLFGIIFWIISNLVVPVLIFGYSRIKNYSLFDTHQTLVLLSKSWLNSWDTWILIIIVNIVTSVVTLFIRMISCIFVLGLLLLPLIETLQFLIFAVFLSNIYERIDNF